ncbi:DUF2834 domain-containing protein [Celeribacter neptunius]|uniref:DUF2834 domain-containing protein n=1 Tax=Celeribacter neptunius TaxID=588602 RepID=A0A1I3QFT7_9RHOB|nr:DUF2834 domain-containing protein [Celeribacter neptunius]SFJ32181.1 Protein of unknown function [Celeribacter neptunius]
MPGSRFWFLLALLGTVIPWVFFGSWFAANGLSPLAFIADLFVNGAAAGFSADVLISIATFWIWSYFDAKRQGIRLWWLVLPASFTVGLSLALPLYLGLREKEAA